MRDVLTVEPDRPLRGLEETSYRAPDGGLAATTLPDQSYSLARRNLKGDTVHCMNNASTTTRKAPFSNGKLHVCAVDGN
jgi:hypothetical protein